MSVSAGPSSVTDGLVFYCDMSNPVKSWKGKPATNTCSFGTYDYGYNSTKISNATPPIPPPVTGYPIYKITSNDGNDSQQILYTATVDQVNGGTYTHSAYVYLESGSWVSAGQHWNPWDYGTQQFIPKGVWTRIEDPVTNSTNNYGNVAMCYNTNGAVYVTGSQYELGSFASPLVNGTRSNTQALVDLTGNNTLTATSLTYDSNGEFSFNGSGNYIDVTGAGFTSGMTSYTIMHWSRRDVESRMPVAGRTSTAFYQYGDNSWAYTHGGTWGEYYYPKAVSIPLGTWGFYCIVYDGSYVKIYRNGVFEGQQATTGSADWSQGLRIGFWAGGGGYQYSGKIGSVKFYNRGLSATEVQQEFNSRRARFGI